MEFMEQFLMQLVDFFGSYVDWWGRAVSAISSEFDMGIPPVVADFLGFGIGVVILVAFVRVSFKWDRRGDRPQPFPLKTTETPNEVVTRDFERFLMLLLKISLFILFAVTVVSSR